MPTIRDDAICTRHWDWSETSQTVSLFTREHGLLRGLAKGSKREKSPFSGGIELLTRGEVVAITRSTTALSTLIAWDLTETYAPIRGSLRAFYVGNYLIDLVNHAVTDSDPHPALFDCLADSLDGLCREPEWPLLRFQWGVLAETGYLPELAVDVRSGEPLRGAEGLVFLPRLGGLAQVDPGSEEGWRVRGATVALLRAIDTHPRGPAAKDAVARGSRLLASYLRHVLGTEPPSMRAVFGRDSLPK